MPRETSATGWKTEPFNADEDNTPESDGETPDVWNDASVNGLPAFVDPDIGEELEEEGPPDWMGIRWRDIDESDSAEAWTVLRQWVDWFIREYSLTTSQITPCWYEHADVVAELYAAMCAEYKVWEEGMPGLAPMTTWHPHVQALKTRLAEITSKRQCAPTRKHHPDVEDLPFTYDQESWARVRDGHRRTTELPRGESDQWWRPVTGNVTGGEFLVGGIAAASDPVITGTTLLSGAAADTFQARHTTSPRAETHWEYTNTREGTADWTRHVPGDESTG